MLNKRKRKKIKNCNKFSKYINFYKLSREYEKKLSTKWGTIREIYKAKKKVHDDTLNYWNYRNKKMKLKTRRKKIWFDDDDLI